MNNITLEQLMHMQLLSLMQLNHAELEILIHQVDIAINKHKTLRQWLAGIVQHKGGAQ